MHKECNVGTTDKIIRVVIGLVTIWLAVQFSYWWLILTIIMFATAGMGWCPVNKMLGMNTCHVKGGHGKDEHKKEESSSQQEEKAPAEESTHQEEAPAENNEETTSTEEESSEEEPKHEM